MDEVVVVTGAGSIGHAVARRVNAGKHVVLADLHREKAKAPAELIRKRRIGRQHGNRRCLVARIASRSR